jgi:hypothetical protein
MSLVGLSCISCMYKFNACVVLYACACSNYINLFVDGNYSVCLVD